MRFRHGQNPGRWRRSLAAESFGHPKPALACPEPPQATGFTSGRAARILRAVPDSSAPDRRFANVDERTRARIVAAYAQHGLSLRLLGERFRLGVCTLKRVLGESGIEIRTRGRPCDFYPDMP